MHVVSDTLEAPALPGATLARRGPSRAARMWARDLAEAARDRASRSGSGRSSSGPVGRTKRSCRHRSPSSRRSGDERAALWDATVTTMARAIQGYLIALVIGVALGLAVSRSRILAGRHRFDDHRPADDAVDRVVPLRDLDVPVERSRDLVRRRPWCDTVDRERDHHRRRPHRAGTAAGRTRPRCARASR